MNSKQLKAKRRRTRQKVKKQQSRNNCPPQLIPIERLPSDVVVVVDSILNKRVTFDYFCMNSDGILLKPVIGIVLKKGIIEQDSDDADAEVLTIKIIENFNCNNKRIEALLSTSEKSDPSVITVTRSSLINFKLQH